jgi:glycosyltransferase involved in cell wall biosynthesis
MLMEPAATLPLSPGAAAGRRIEAVRPAAARVCVVVPCYNVAPMCRQVIEQAARFADLVIAVDDGSTDGTADVLRALATACRAVTVLRMDRNRGKGAALLRAFRHALAHVRFDVLVTLDADAQHRPDDIPRLVQAWTRGADLVIGARTVPDSPVPIRSSFGNRYMRRVVAMLHVDGPTDTQSGFRAHDRALVRRLAAIVPAGRYETEMAILLLALREGWRLDSVPIACIYLDRNRSSHFRPIVDSARVWRTLCRVGGLRLLTEPRAWRLLRETLAERPYDRSAGDRLARAE